MSSRYFLPEVLETNNQLTLSNPSGTNDILVAASQKFLVLDTLINTTNYTVGERTLDCTSFPSTTVHLRYNLNGNPVNSFTPSGLDNFYLVDSADTTYNPNNAIGFAIADDGGSLTDETTAANEATSDDMTLLPATPIANDAYYFGHGTAFSRLTLNISTALVEASGDVIILVWEYYNGSSWTAIPTDTLVDGTTFLTVSGTNDVTFSRPNDWATTSIGFSGETDSYYIRVRVTAVSGTPLDSVPAGQQAWIGTAEAHFESIADDAFLGRIVTGSGGSIVSISSISNPSKLVVQKGLFEDTLTQNQLVNNNISNNTQTINQGEAGAGVGGGTGTAGWIIDRGSLANFEIRYDDNNDMLNAGLAGALRPIPRFVDAAPADGRVIFTDQTIGDEVGVDALYWDKANNRLGIGVASPLDALDVSGEIRVSTGFHTNIDTGHFDLNVDSSGNAIETGFATQLIGLGAGGFKLRTANQSITAGAPVTWREVFETNVSGESGIGISGQSGIRLSLAGNLKLWTNTPIISAANTNRVGLLIQIENAVSSTGTLFRIRDDSNGINNVLIQEDSVWLVKTDRFNIYESGFGSQAELEVGSINGHAKLKLDGATGDFGVGNNWAEIYHDGIGNKLVISTFSSGGDVIISPTLSGTSSTGNVGIGNSDMTTEHKLDVLGNIQTRTGTPAFVLKDTTASNQVWNMYQSARTFHIGEDITPANAAISIAFGGVTAQDISFGTNFFWDRGNSRLGINQSTPLHPLHVQSATGIQIHARATGSTDGAIEIDNSNASNDAKLILSINSSDQWELVATDVTSFDILNVGGNSAISIAKSTNDITFDGNLYYDVTNGGVSQLNFFLSSRMETKNATNKGFIKIDGNSSSVANGGIEFQTTETGSGDGVRLYTNEITVNNISKFAIAHRLNNAAWTETFSVTRNISGTTAVNIVDIPIYPDNSTAAAILNTGDIYMETATGMLRIVF